ncbi:MAG: restriction endonuclease subunit S, partial [candidate division WOR-3 bacterium]|nr:restriction endonuclease subunit S [candidate division WOR-3 bacterium]
MNNLWQLPEGWKWVKLGEVCNIRAGGTPSRSIEEYWGGSIPWVKISDIPEDGHVYETEET